MVRPCRIFLTWSAITIWSTTPSQPIKQWNQFLSSTKNNIEIIAFLINDWKTKMRIIADKYLYVGHEDKCYCFTQVTIMMSQNYSQEEADTRMLLHMKHNANQSKQAILFVVHSPDTDVFLLCLGHLNQINGKIFIKTGVKDNTRLINLRKIKNKLELEDDEVGLISFHTFTGCDTISAFAGKGKLKALKIMMVHWKYVAAN